MRNLITIAIAVGILTMTSACQQSAAKKQIIDFNSLNDQKGSNSDKAEAISLAAEKLVYSDGFMFAGAEFEAALKIDPTNARAKFYTAILAVAEVNRGMATRVDPVVSKIPVDSQRGFQTAVDDFPASNTKDFALDGQANISSEHDIQNHLRTVQNSLRTVRTMLEDLRQSNQTLALHAKTPQANVTAQQLVLACPVKKLSNGKFEYTDCDLMSEVTVAFNWADFAAAKMTLASYIIFLSQGTAYDLQGGENVARRLIRYNNVTEEMLVWAIKKESQLGKLADVGVLKEIQSMGAEGIEAVKEAKSHQAELCPAGVPSPNSRPGNLISDGICIEKQFMDWMAVAEVGLKGPQAVQFTNSWAVVDGSKVLNGSITDLKTELPDRFDRCGQSTSLPDRTFGGTFPNGDGIQTIKANDQSFLNKPCFANTGRR